MSLRLGVIGAGGIGTLHAETASRVGLEIVGVCDADITRATRLAGRFNGAAPTDSPAALLGNKDIDAVVVAVPNVHHAALAIQSLNAGKHVLLEKPMAMTLAECDAILDAQRGAKRMLQLGFVSRCAPAAKAARQFISDGKLGRIYHVKAAMYRRRGIPGLGRWFTTKSESGGGALIDIGVHLIDIVLHLAGQPTAKSAFGLASSSHGMPISSYRTTEMWAGPPNPQGTFDVEDAITALVQCEGMTIELNAMWAGNFPQGSLRDGITLLGDKGGCHIDLWTNKLTLAGQHSGFACDITPDLGKIDPWREAWEGEWRMFVDAVLNGAALNATGDDGRRVQAIVEAIYRSCSTGKNEPVSA